MAVEPAMFVYEVVVEDVNVTGEGRSFIIKADFADIFSLELKDPKQMHIVMPEPLPLPPDPPGKKKKAPKPKRGKKGGLLEVLAPEPVIQAGQSVLFASTPEFLIQNMNNCPMELSLWSKEDYSQLVGSRLIPWDPIFLKYLEEICNCENPQPVTLNETYNLYDENKAKIVAKLGIQIKLTYLKDKVTTAFRTLSEDPNVRKYLYTGINSKTTSYICTLKTTDEEYIENCNKVEAKYVKDNRTSKKLAFADYHNAPGANVVLCDKEATCCLKNTDKSPASIYKAAESQPDIDFIIDYVRKIIVSCNDNMRMLTPRATITPRVRATDIDRLCYCHEKKWPEGELAKRFKKEVQSEPCAVCADAIEKNKAIEENTFDMAKIRGPCGRVDCRVARGIRGYIDDLMEEDKREVDMNKIIGPCGSKSCIVAKKVQEFILHKGPFKSDARKAGLQTQCACLNTMQNALVKTKSCESECQNDCKDDSDSSNNCNSSHCPFTKKPNVENVFYFTTHYDMDKSSPGDSSPDDSKSEKSRSVCSPDRKLESTCSTRSCVSSNKNDKTYPNIFSCPTKEKYPPSPADSDIVINFDDIQNTCCVKSCDVADTVKDMIVDGVLNKKSLMKTDDNCWCNCDCEKKLTRRTTYCAVCGGYEVLGFDMENLPEHAKPQPCPIFHKTYDKKFIKVKGPWDDQEKKETQKESVKAIKTSSPTPEDNFTDYTTGASNFDAESKKSEKKPAAPPKKVGKFTQNLEKKQEPPKAADETSKKSKKTVPAVPKHMGWLWTSESIPALKFRPAWKPGATHKLLARRYKQMKLGLDVIAKKKRAMLNRKKKLEPKPTIVVTKKEGEYTVQMEVFKKYSKERLRNQYPYDEKPPLFYTIGKTAEEKRRLQVHKERKERRETRRKAKFLQSTFRDKCQEICVKAYNQAMGILPLPNANDPECPCQTHEPTLSPPIDSCSCSESESISSSDTDDDEWTIEFTPPAGKWDPKAKNPPVTSENESQYTYLDYKVKVLDKSGNQVPRYFKGPDGKQVCSDLGGFYDTRHVWNEINKDGYIGPDNRWVPMFFIGPDGKNCSAEEGSFMDNDGNLVKIGIDGYIDQDLKWVWYSKGKSRAKSSLYNSEGKSDAKGPSTAKRATSPAKDKQPQQQGQSKGKDQGAKNANDPNPKKKTVTIKAGAGGGRGGKNTVMNVMTNYEGHGFSRLAPILSPHHRVGEHKIRDPHQAKYMEIMQELQMYDDLAELKMVQKINRATNTAYRNCDSYGSRGCRTTKPAVFSASSHNNCPSSRCVGTIIKC